MIYHTVYVDWDDRLKMTAGPKGIGDIVKILSDMGVRNIDIPTFRSTVKLSPVKRAVFQKKIYDAWNESCRCLSEGDWLIVDIPQFERFIGFTSLMKSLKKRGVRLCFMIVDFNMLRNVRYRRLGRLKNAIIQKEEQFILENADLILSHNEVQAEALRKLGASSRIECYGLFDYLAEENIRQRKVDGRKGPVVIAANLDPEKAGFVEKLPENYRFNLYGANYRGGQTDNVRYCGAFGAEELISVVEGSYGLVWDGDSTEGCSGNFGEYMRYNTPHKASFYLACGLPVIVWSEAAISEIILENGCGFAINSIDEIADIIHSLTDEEYESMKRNAEAAGERLRNGCSTKGIARKAFGI